MVKLLIIDYIELQITKLNLSSMPILLNFNKTRLEIGLYMRKNYRDHMITAH